MKLLSISSLRRIAPVALIILSLVLGFLGLKAQFAAQSLEPTGWELLYRTLQLFFLGYGGAPGESVNGMLQIARFTAPLSLSWAALDAAFTLVDERFLRWKYSRKKGHTLIIGLNDFTRRVWGSNSVDALLLVDKPGIHRARAIVEKPGWLEGDVLNSATLRCGSFHSARNIYVDTGSDSRNIDICQKIISQLSAHHNERIRPGVLIGHIADPNLKQALCDYPVFRTDSPWLSARFTDCYSSCARSLLESHGPLGYVPEPSYDANEEIRLMIIGNHAFTESLLLQIARTCHYGPAYKLKIIWVAESASGQWDELCNRIPAAKELLDLELIDSQLSFLQRPELEELLGRIKPRVIYVTEARTAKVIELSSTLEALPGGAKAVICFTGQEEQSALLRELANQIQNIDFVDLYKAQSQLSSLFDEKQDILARKLHEHYMQSQLDLEETKMQNPSLVSWYDLDESLKNSNRSSADHIPIKLRLLLGSQKPTPEGIQKALTDDAIEALAKAEHERWMADKLLDGWQHRDEPKNTTRRVNPCLVPWSRLPEEERQKDRNMVNSLGELSALLH